MSERTCATCRWGVRRSLEYPCSVCIRGFEAAGGNLPPKSEVQLREMVEAGLEPKHEPSWLEVVGMVMMCVSVFGTMLLLWALLVG